MNAPELAQAAYRDAFVPVRTDRQTEYDAFARITFRIRDAASRGREGFPALADAIHDNRRLWTILAADIAGPENQLPPDLKARLLYLAEFSTLHGSRVLAGKADPSALVEINGAIMQGLRQKGTQR